MGGAHRRGPHVNGRRGAYLLLKSAIFVALGLTYAIPSPYPGTERSLSFLAALGVPVWAAGIPWLVAGVVGVVGAFRRPPGRDGWAFGALAGVAAAWAMVYTIGWMLGESPRGYFLALIFGALAGATLLVSGMVDPHNLQRAQPEGDR